MTKEWKKVWKEREKKLLKKILSKAHLEGRYEVLRLYDSLLEGIEGKSFLEIGAGTGRISLLLALRGARVTLLDNSRAAIRLQKKLFKKWNVSGRFVLADAFDVDIENEFDVVHSDGLIEHFSRPKRKLLLRKHIQAARGGGKVLIIVPNKRNPFYRIGKSVLERTGRWPLGQEVPLRRQELVGMMRECDLKNIKSGGVYLWASLAWLFAPVSLEFAMDVKHEIIAKNLRRIGVYDCSQNALYSSFGRMITVVGEK